MVIYICKSLKKTWFVVWVVFVFFCWKGLYQLYPIRFILMKNPWNTLKYIRYSSLDPWNPDKVWLGFISHAIPRSRPRPQATPVLEKSRYGRRLVRWLDEAPVRRRVRLGRTRELSHRILECRWFYGTLAIKNGDLLKEIWWNVNLIN